MPIVADFRSLSNPAEIDYLRERGAERPEDHFLRGSERKESSCACLGGRGMKQLALPSSPPDPHSFSPCALGAAAPPRIRSKDFYILDSQVLTNAQVQKSGPVGSPSQEGFSCHRHRISVLPIRPPLGSRAAREHHGGKAGRLLQQRCKCGGQMQYDENEEAFCTKCNLGPEKRVASPRRSGHERAKLYKKYRMYAKSIWQIQDNKGPASVPDLQGGVHGQRHSTD